MEIVFTDRRFPDHFSAIKCNEEITGQSERFRGH
jgi:hypothetical protein